MNRSSFLSSDQEDPRRNYSGPGYYVVDRDGHPQDGPFDTQSLAFANLQGRDAVEFLDQPTVASPLEAFPPPLTHSLGSKKDDMPRTAAQLRAAETETLRALHTAHPSEGPALLAALDSIRAEASLASQSDYDWEATTAAPPAWAKRTSAFTANTLHTSKSDWIDDIPLPGHVAASAIVAAANMWFEAVPPNVRGNWGEYVTQAHSAAQVECSRHQAGHEAYSTFMDVAERLHKVAVRTTATDALLPWAAVLPPLPPTMVGANSAPDLNQVNPEPGNTGQPQPLMGAPVNDEFGYEPSAEDLGRASAGGGATNTVADLGFQDATAEPNPDPAAFGQRQSAYNPLSDPQSAYNNPGKGPHSGVPSDLFPDGIPLHGDLNDEQQAWMDQGRKKTASSAHTFPRQSYEEYLKAITADSTPVPEASWAGMAASVAPVGPSAQRTAALKMSPEHVEKMRSLIAPHDTETNRNAYINGNFPRADRVKDVNMRYRWDLYHASGAHAAIQPYDHGYHDTHIDSALKNIVSPLGGMSSKTAAQRTAAPSDQQVNYEDPEGKNIGRNEAPGAGDWANVLPEAGVNFSNLTAFPDTGPAFVPSTRDGIPGAEGEYEYQNGVSTTARRKVLSAQGLRLVTADDDDDDDDDDEVGPGQALSPAARQLSDAPGQAPAVSSGPQTDWTGDHDPVTFLGTVPVEGYVLDADHPNAEAWAWEMGPVGSVPTGAAAVSDVPTPGMVSAQEDGMSYPQPRGLTPPRPSV